MKHLNEYMKALLPIVIITFGIYYFDLNRNPSGHKPLLEIFGGVMVIVLILGAIKEYNRNDEV